MKYIIQIILLFLSLYISVNNLTYYVRDHDIWWHLQIGKDLFSSYNWPSPDSYSYISNSIWVVHSWLADLLLYLIYTIFDFITFNYFSDKICIDIIRNIILYIYIVILLVYVYKRTKDIYIVAIVLLIVSYIFSNFTLRPFIFNPIFVMYYYYLFSKNILFKHDYIISSILMIIWVNVHGLFIFVVIYVVTMIIHGMINNKGGKNRLYLFLLLSSFVTYDPFSLYIRIVNAPYYPTNDWNSILYLFYLSPLFFYPYIILFIVVFIIWILYNSKYVNISENKFIYELYVFIYYLLFYRHVWLLFIPLLPITCSYMIHYKENRYYKMLCTITIICMSLCFYIITLKHVPMYNYLQKELPQDIMEYVVKHDLHGKYYSPYTWSGYITWKTNSQSKIFVDTRLEPFTEDQVNISLDVLTSLEKNIDELVSYDTEYIILPKDYNHLQIDKMIYRGVITTIYYDDVSKLYMINYSQYESE